ncbi:topoisomerase 1-associated factor 1 isoform X2 [Amaranthus tricolor]|uniref:topoisomerase 1-associated factor 1 isoform X2 n=1 Tax=Amaranthus tricolor TaxID=29722 RepID=UPI00258DA459|nr:topoisomerase 1-associated factor 1 isoform X2 [Amaranthus tricolor]
MDTEGLSITCAGLGSVENDEDGNTVYVKEEFCSDNLKDLLRYLRRDDPENREVFKQVCKWDIVSKDLIPIIEFCQDDRNLVINAVKVLVFLTMPLEAMSKDFNEQLEFLWGIKQAITSSNVVTVIVSLLEKPLENLECKAFSEDDWKLVQLVLTLFRNILAVQDISAHQKALGSATIYISLRDDFLDLLFRENVMDLIIIITQHVGSCRYLRHDNFLLLEIYYHIFMGQDPELIAKICLEESKVDEEAKPCLESLRCIMQEETEKRKLTRSHATRHSKFSGTFTRLTLDGSKTMCKGVPSSACDKLLKPEKVHRGRLKRIVKDYVRLPTMKRSILERLHDFIGQFLSGGYNVLMQLVAQDIEKEHDDLQTSDVHMFFHLAQFATCFQFHKFQSTKSNSNADVNTEFSVSDDDDSTLFKGELCGPIASTLNDSMFGLVIAKWQFAFDGLKEIKNNAFLSVAGSLLKIMVAKKSRKAKKKQDMKNRENKTVGDDATILNEIQSLGAKNLPPAVDHCDKEGSAEALYDEQEANTVSQLDKIKISRDKRQDSTFSLPVGDLENSHPSYDQLGDEEYNKIGESRRDEESNQIHVSRRDEESNQTHEPLSNHGKASQTKDGDVINGGDDCDSSADEQHTVTNEVDFNMTPLLLSLANSAIISNLCWLLKFYKSNSIATNHYILCLLKRVSDDLDLAPMLYQLSCLVIFYDILNEQKACPNKEYQNIVHFLTTFVRRMMRKMKDQPLLFVDLLFWKTRRDCQYINVEYIRHEVSGFQKGVRKWEHADETDPSQSKNGVRKSFADALGDDEYDVILPNQHFLEKDEDEAAGDATYVNDPGNKAIKENCVEDDLQGIIKRKRRLVLNDKLEEDIKGLYEKYKDNPNCTQLIAESLDPDGNISLAQVFRTCKKLGLQLPSKKSSNIAYLPNDINQDENGKPEIGITLQDSNHRDRSSDLGRPMKVRKRGRAINENQELKIRSLFEHFKDHNRCSHMIAKALDPNGTVTAVQVSRKLKKLGLHTSRMRSKPNKQKMDDVSTDDEDDLDNQPLSLLRKRNKNEDTSSKEHLGSSNYNHSSRSHSDDEQLISSILKKSRTSKDKVADASTNTTNTVREDTRNQSSESLEERDKQKETKGVSSAHQAAKLSEWDERIKYDRLSDTSDGASDHGSPGSDAQNDAILDSGRKRRSLALDDDAGTVQHEHNYSELEDSGDEQAPRTSPENSQKRRKLRIVMDFDDDE